MATVRGVQAKTVGLHGLAKEETRTEFALALHDLLVAFAKLRIACGLQALPRGALVLDESFWTEFHQMSSALGKENLTT